MGDPLHLSDVSEPRLLDLRNTLDVLERLDGGESAMCSSSSESLPLAEMTQPSSTLLPSCFLSDEEVDEEEEKEETVRRLPPWPARFDVRERPDRGDSLALLSFTSSSYRALSALNILAVPETILAAEAGLSNLPDDRSWDDRVIL